jgi:putative SOS response-associated peptidase YedK
MCGRYAITTAPEAIRRLFGIGGPTSNFGPRYNAAPGQELPVIRRDPKSGERVLGPLATTTAGSARNPTWPA